MTPSRSILVAIVSIACWISFAAHAAQLPDEGPRSVPGPNPAPSAALPSPRTADEAFDEKARALELQIVGLKERVLQARERLRQLGCVTEGCDPNAPARLVLTQRNNLAPAFSLEAAVYALDGATLPPRSNLMSDAAKAGEIELTRLNLPPGNHLLRAHLVVVGRGVGPIQYSEGYRFTIDSSATLKLAPGVTTLVHIVGWDRGLGTQYVDRPAVRFDVSPLR